MAACPELNICGLLQTSHKSKCSVFIINLLKDVDNAETTHFLGMDWIMFVCISVLLTVTIYLCSFSKSFKNFQVSHKHPGAFRMFATTVFVEGFGQETTHQAPGPADRGTGRCWGWPPPHGAWGYPPLWASGKWFVCWRWDSTAEPLGGPSSPSGSWSTPWGGSEERRNVRGKTPSWSTLLLLWSRTIYLHQFLPSFVELTWTWTEEVHICEQLHDLSRYYRDRWNRYTRVHVSVNAHKVICYMNKSKVNSHLMSLLWDQQSKTEQYL